MRYIALLRISFLLYGGCFAFFEPDPKCESGVVKRGVCCPKACGGMCGVKGCSHAPGGVSSCCASAIKKTGRPCLEYAAPCVMGALGCTFSVGEEYVGNDVKVNVQLLYRQELCRQPHELNPINPVDPLLSPHSSYRSSRIPTLKRPNSKVIANLTTKDECCAQCQALIIDQSLKLPDCLTP